MADTLEVRKEYRLQEWAQIIEACRASGLSNRDFCKQHGIPEKTFYYRLKQLREAAIQQQECPKLVQLEEVPTAQPVPTQPLLHISYCGATLDLPAMVDLDAVAALLKSIQTL